MTWQQALRLTPRFGGACRGVLPGPRGRAQAFGGGGPGAVLVTCHRPQCRGRGIESEQVALQRGRLDAVIAGAPLHGGMRRSEVNALRWADVAAAADGEGVLVTVRRGKSQP